MITKRLRNYFFSVNINFNKTEYVIKKMQKLKGRTKIKICENFSEFCDQMNYLFLTKKYSFS